MPTQFVCNNCGRPLTGMIDHLKEDDPENFLRDPMQWVKLDPCKWCSRIRITIGIMVGLLLAIIGEYYYYGRF